MNRSMMRLHAGTLLRTPRRVYSALRGLVAAALDPAPTVHDHDDVLHPKVADDHPAHLCQCPNGTLGGRHGDGDEHLDGCLWVAAWCNTCAGSGYCPWCLGDGYEAKPTAEQLQ